MDGFQKPDPVEADIIRIVETIAEEARTADDWSYRKWTSEITQRLGKLGASLGYHPCCQQCWGMTDKAWGEFLWDLSWLKYSANGQLAGQPLALECESGNDKDIDGDFSKLLVAGAAQHKVMIMGSKDPPERHFARLQQIVADSEIAPVGDRYLLMSWIPGDKFKSWVFVKTGRNSSA